MKQIKTLTVNGERFRITDPEAARIDNTAVGSSAWSGKEILDRLCLPLEATGLAVQCAPASGYPLSVVTQLPTEPVERLTLRHSGKNIFDIATAGVYHSNPAQTSHQMTVTDTGIYLTPVRDLSSNWSKWGFGLGTVKELAGKTITLSAKVHTTAAATTTLPRCEILCTSVKPTQVRDNPVLANGGYVGSSGTWKTLKECGVHSGYATATYTVTGEEQFGYIGICFQSTYGVAIQVGEWTAWSDIQVEIGNTATAYAPYNGHIHSVDFGKAVYGGAYDWTKGVLTDADGNETQLTPREILALGGTNTLYGDAGNTTVKGKADPVAEMEKLKNAILALGGNV